MAIDKRPLTARSVIASTLLGTEPPSMSAGALVRVGEIFGISEGTVRVALSRMAASGELEHGEGHYRLGPQLAARQRRLSVGRNPPLVEWDGSWETAVVTGPGRSPELRTTFRTTMGRLGLAELREGVWMRPANLDPGREGWDRSEVSGSVHRFVSRPGPRADGRSLAAELWDLEGWAADARTLEHELETLTDALVGEANVLRPGFETSAAVLRQLVTDPVLPTELQPAGWPAASLRQAYEVFDSAYRRSLAVWLAR